MITDSLPSIPVVDRPVQQVAPPTFEQLYEDCYPYIATLVRRYRWTKETTEDVLQCIFLKVWRALPTFTPIPSESGHTHKGHFNAYLAWMIGIARHSCIDEYRRQHGTYTQEPLTPWHEASLLDTRDELGEVEVRECCARLLALLPKRDVYLLRQIASGYKYREVAKMTGISENACRSRILRARMFLRASATAQEVA